MAHHQDVKELTTNDLKQLGSRLLQKSRHKFLGVFPAHSLPYRRERQKHLQRICFIVNTHTSSGGGVHWVAFCFDEKGHGHFFDSYGKKPAVYHRDWTQYLDSHCRYWTYNSKIVQKGLQPTCGYHCLYYLYRRGMYTCTHDKLLLANHSDDNVLRWFRNKVASY